MGLFDYVAVTSVCLSLLAALCSALALRSARDRASQSTIKRLLEHAEAKATLWQTTAEALKREVSYELDRLEQKRRTLAGVESRLKSRDQGEVEEQMNEPEVPEDPPDRATVRMLRRMGKG